MSANGQHSPLAARIAGDAADWRGLHGSSTALAAPPDADLPAAVRAAIGRLAATRPTAVNLFWALERMRAVVDGDVGTDRQALCQRLLAEAVQIHQEDRRVCRAIGRNAQLIQGFRARARPTGAAGSCSCAGATPGS